ncbi:MAG: hypothetical protein CM1200mP30_16110 [Pseudomonadota bacterium]|nr:MAG: hypothetical protein CM1200mP30_16110 [Pseudomonadota bacterium]
MLSHYSFVFGCSSDDSSLSSTNQLNLYKNSNSCIYTVAVPALFQFPVHLQAEQLMLKIVVVVIVRCCIHKFKVRSDDENLSFISRFNLMVADIKMADGDVKTDPKL